MSKGVWMAKWYHENNEKYNVDRNRLIQIVLSHYPKAGLLIGIHDGNPPDVKDHDHWYLGWYKNMPEYEDFKKFMEDTGFQCFKSAQKAKCYHPNKQREYLMHMTPEAQKANKIPYDEDHIIEMNWIPNDYMTKSQLKSEERGDNPFIQIYQFMDSVDVRSYTHLVHLAMKDHPEWLYWIHLDSAKYARYIKDMHDNRLETAEAQNEEYRNMIDMLRSDICTYQSTLQQKNAIIDAYRKNDPVWQEKQRKVAEERAKFEAMAAERKAA